MESRAVAGNRSYIQSGGQTGNILKNANTTNLTWELTKPKRYFGRSKVAKSDLADS